MKPVKIILFRPDARTNSDLALDIYAIYEKVNRNSIAWNGESNVLTFERKREWDGKNLRVMTTLPYVMEEEID